MKLENENTVQVEIDITQRELAELCIGIELLDALEELLQPIEGAGQIALITKDALRAPIKRLAAEATRLHYIQSEKNVSVGKCLVCGKTVKECECRACCGQMPEDCVCGKDEWRD